MSESTSRRDGLIFLVIGWGVWGKGEILTEALTNAKNAGGSDYYAAFLCSTEWEFDMFTVTAEEVHKLGWFTKSFKPITDEAKGKAQKKAKQ